MKVTKCKTCGENSVIDGRCYSDVCPPNVHANAVWEARETGAVIGRALGCLVGLAINAGFVATVVPILTYPARRAGLVRSGLVAGLRQRGDRS